MNYIVESLKKNERTTNELLEMLSKIICNDSLFDAALISYIKESAI